MLNRRSFSIVCALSAFVVCASARADLVDSPQYKSWVKFKVGTKVVYHNQTAGASVPMTQTITWTIKEITPDKVVLDIASKMDMQGMSRDLPGRTQDVPAKVEQKDQYLPAGFTGSVKEAGTETIESGGKKYECKVYEFTPEETPKSGARPTVPGTRTGKVWRNDDVPGGQVKLTIHAEAQGMQADVTVTLMSVEAK